MSREEELFYEQVYAAALTGLLAGRKEKEMNLDAYRSTADHLARKAVEDRREATATEA